MKISEILAAYYEATAKVSEIVRQLDLAGIGVIWIFRVGTESGGIKYSSSLLLPLALFVASLAFDLLQYAYKSLVWGALNSHYWRIHRNNDVDVSISGKWNWFSAFLFWSKTVLTLVAYTMLFIFIFRQL